MNTADVRRYACAIRAHVLERRCLRADDALTLIATVERLAAALDAARTRRMPIRPCRRAIRKAA